jgi:hypothetical protein
LLAGADTGTGTGLLMLAARAGLADVERDLIHIRTAEAGAALRTKEAIWTGRFPHTGATERGHPALARGAVLQELAQRYYVRVLTIRRVTSAAA